MYARRKLINALLNHHLRWPISSAVTESRSSNRVEVGSAGSVVRWSMPSCAAVQPRLAVIAIAAQTAVT